MIVVAGPPGSGKSSAFPIAHFDVDYFNADDVAAVLNGGSYVDIPPEIRQRVNRQFEQFVDEHIRSGESFAIETTLRTNVTFQQAGRARAKGFVLIMYYIAVSSARAAIERVMSRADAGGHSAPATVLRQMYHLSLGHLHVAIRQFDRVFVFDNSAFSIEPRLVLEGGNGSMYFIGSPRPRWLRPVIDKVLTVAN